MGSQPRTLVVVQARTGSTRLPGKVLLPLAGRPLLARLLERVRAAETAFALAVATTAEAADEPVRRLCRELRHLDVECFSGHPTDLLDRHLQAARAAGGTGGGAVEVVVKIPSDCPLIDPGVVDRVLGFYLARTGAWDYASNLHPATYPDGNDVEVMSFAALETAWREATRPHEREHTTPYIWDQPERFRVANVAWETGQDLSMSHRWTIDYPEDYELIRAVYDELWSTAHPVFSLAEILALVAARPELQRLNARYAGVNWYRHHLGELRTVGPHQTQPPPVDGKPAALKSIRDELI
jgi:spore coat polysaccharide biosynthesis protein SpsF